LIYNKLECDFVFKIDKNDNDNIYIILNINTINELPEKYIIYNLEQLISDRIWKDDFYDKCKKAINIFDYSLENIKIFKKNDLLAYHLPYGWSPIIDPEYEIKFNEKKIDLIFLGNISDRRMNILNNFKNIYIDNKCHNEEYENITSKAKFSLNIHNYTGRNILEVTRIIPLICRGVMIISEKSNDEYYDSIFKDIIIFNDFKDIREIYNIISNYDYKTCISNKEKLINKLNFVNIISEKIKLF
jgi:hypothetical protein